MKRALIFSPYFDTWGGGEVYTFCFANCLHDLGYQITLATKSHQVLEAAKSFLDISLQAKIDPQAHLILSSPGKLFSKYKLTSTYDLVFFLSDGSIPFLFGHKNIVHFQVPFTKLQRSLITSLKLPTINHIVCNSSFTKKVIDSGLGTNSTVLYPPVRLVSQGHQLKDNIILSVGRFTQTMHNKRQDVLIKAFKKMIDQGGAQNWRLVIVGSTTEQGSQELESKLKTEAKGYSIEIITDMSYQNIRKLYAQARIFWLATGYDINENTHPEGTEHFGIATVEAMSAGAVPVAIKKGGQPEIITEGINGFLFTDIDQLVAKTSRLISDSKLIVKMSQQAEARSHDFSQEQFNFQIKSLIS